MNLSDRIDAVIGGAHNLPTLPGVAMRLLQTVDSTDFCLRDIAEIISTDPPLSAKVLSLINSPFYGMKTTIERRGRPGSVACRMSRLRRIHLPDIRSSG